MSVISDSRLCTAGPSYEAVLLHCALFPPPPPHPLPWETDEQRINQHNPHQLLMGLQELASRRLRKMAEITVLFRLPNGTRDCSWLLLKRTLLDCNISCPMFYGEGGYGKDWSLSTFLTSLLFLRRCPLQFSSHLPPKLCFSSKTINRAFLFLKHSLYYPSVVSWYIKINFICRRVSRKMLM